MDRRSFLTGMLGMAGAAAVVTAVKPTGALAGIPQRPGILDELETADAANGDAAVELVDHRRDHRRRHGRDRDRHHRRRRRRRRREWRTVCRRHRLHSGWRKVCHRERVWVWYWSWR